MLNTHYNLIKSKLEDHIWFRERKRKNEGIARLLIKKYNLELNPILLADMIVEASTLDRSWRKVLSENPHLQGSDYNHKEVLEHKEMLSQGYEVGYHKDIKQTKLL